LYGAALQFADCACADGAHPIHPRASSAAIPTDEVPTERDALLLPPDVLPRVVANSEATTI
jgi:hypothetical protein